MTRQGGRMPARSLPFDQWPAKDRAAWELARRDGGIFDPQGPAARWSDKTCQNGLWTYGRFLRFLADSGQLDPDEPIAERVTPVRIRAFCKALDETVAPRTTGYYLNQLCSMLPALTPDTDWRWLFALKNRLLRLHTRPARDKRRRMRDSRTLFALGIRLMETTHLQPKALAAAIQYRDGLIIALLAARPLRRRTFAAITLGRQLQKIGNQWFLQFDRGDTKTGRPLEYAFPQALVPYLTEYLAQHRPVFPGADRHNALWASAKGRALTDDGIYQRVCQRTEAEFGEPINLHLFRDCAASTLVNQDPDHVGAAAPLLGHAQHSTTERFYLHADQHKAVGAYQAVVAARRGQRGRDQ